MNDLIFSLNATIPIFLIILLGYLLRKVGLFTEKFIPDADRFNFRVTLPILLFVDIATADITSRFDWKFVVFCMGTTTISFLLIWGAARLLLRKKEMVGAFTMSSFRGSAAVLGIAFVTNIYGEAGLAPLMIVAVVPLYNIFSVIVLSLGSEEPGSKVSYGKVLKGIVTNPLILAIFLAFPFAAFSVRIPHILLQSLESMGSIATPLALLLLGASFRGDQVRGKLGPALGATFIKLVLLPGTVVLAAVLCGFRGAALVAIAVMMASPTTVACYTMAKNMKNDADLTSEIVMLTTLFSSVTLTLLIYILKALNYI
ncbi:MAG: AEC family transporter [Lachnospiraceae bacterium]|nr:AEC family transporter [Lachnospiraceae bacterium]